MYLIPAKKPFKYMLKKWYWFLVPWNSGGCPNKSINLWYISRLNVHGPHFHTDIGTDPTSHLHISLSIWPTVLTSETNWTIQCNQSHEMVWWVIGIQTLKKIDTSHTWQLRWDCWVLNIAVLTKMVIHFFAIIRGSDDQGIRLTFIWAVGNRRYITGKGVGLV